MREGSNHHLDIYHTAKTACPCGRGYTETCECMKTSSNEQPPVTQFQAIADVKFTEELCVKNGVDIAINSPNTFGTHGVDGSVNAITPTPPVPQMGAAFSNARDENTCQDCGQENPVWFAPNDVWNVVIPSRVAYICPNCFLKRAALQGKFQDKAWELRPEILPSPSDREPEGVTIA